MVEMLLKLKMLLLLFWERIQHGWGHESTVFVPMCDKTSRSHLFLPCDILPSSKEKSLFFSLFFSKFLYTQMYL